MAHYLKGARDFTINGGNFGDQYGSNPESCLDRLNHVSTAGINASNDDDCMDGTRLDLLKELYHWSKDITAPRIFWLDGMAGTGKSAVARSMCHFLHQHSLLGGSFFCSRNDQSCANVKYILPTLAWDLARQDSKYRDAQLGVLQKDPDVACYSVERQVHHLLEVPFCKFEEQAPPIFVVDALDECTNPKDVRKLLETLFSISPQPPVKFFITSRSEPYIRGRGQFSVLRSNAHRILRLHDIENDVVEVTFLFISPDDLPQYEPQVTFLKCFLTNGQRRERSRCSPVEQGNYSSMHLRPSNILELIITLRGWRPVDVDGELFRGPLDAIYTHIFSAALDACTEAERLTG